MAKIEEKGVSIEVLGTCTTNTTEGSKHDAKVEYRHLWSYAQQAALIAVSDKNSQDGSYHLISDPERRAKRIAAHYAHLYFESAKKSDTKIQFYWPALAAFVVKDIVEAYRFAREDVLHREWKNIASAVRNSSASDIGSLLMTEDSPYQHVLRTYSALAKGNLWLFMDIYPWLWFFLEYVINADGSLQNKRVNACLVERNWNTFQKATKRAVEELPFGPNWMRRLANKISNDAVYNKAAEKFSVVPEWSSVVGYGSHTVMAHQAHNYCRVHIKENNIGYRTPPGEYWGKFKEAFYVMESEHLELGRMCKDSAALATIEKLRDFRSTEAISTTYSQLIREHGAPNKAARQATQLKELIAIAEQEQINVLQPLIYADPLLKTTMDVNHRFSRLTNGWLSPKFNFIYRADARNVDPELETVFDASKSLMDRLSGPTKSLPNKSDRMNFVAEIAADFDRLMRTKRSFMEDELRKICGWLNA
ncbi:DUF2515 family protein [Massilia sp. CMS3.1]|uniref:DUF2515 family protein n=1 Tax=Massilia sp. CMS3.1 TaxID=3373083 RepID=UPI003EE50BE6